ncbi:6516_t:CDS:1, partial [Entrophospora sp. SA101]
IIPTAVIPTPLYRQDVLPTRYYTNTTRHYTDRTLYQQDIIPT